jgi:putative ABC transport system ATP-binding protein
VHALAGASIEVVPGEVLVLIGKSGSGKTSLLYCLSGIIRADRGVVRYREASINQMDDDERSRLRREDFGFVFQFGELVPELSLLENVALPLRLRGMKRRPASDEALLMLSRLDIAQEAGKRPAEVSGGQAQRAAVARALVHRPGIVFADEPTGALDVENRERVLDAFLSVAKEDGASVIVVTHEDDIAAAADRVAEMSDGRIVKLEQR